MLKNFDSRDEVVTLAHQQVDVVEVLARGAKKLSRHSNTVKNEVFSVLKARVSDEPEGNWRPQW